MPAINDQGHVDIDDVTITERLFIGNAVADDVVDGGADGFAKTPIAQRGRVGVVGHGEVERHFVEREGGDSGLNFSRQHVQSFSRKPAGLAHSGKGSLSVKLDLAGSAALCCLGVDENHTNCPAIAPAIAGDGFPYLAMVIAQKRACVHFLPPAQPDNSSGAALSEACLWGLSQIGWLWASCNARSWQTPPFADDLMRNANPNDSSAFGLYAPTPLLAALLRATRACSTSWLGKRCAFLLRGIAVRLLNGRPLDVDALGAHMRLYPYNNVCEKRILFTPQYFDPIERDVVRQRLHANAVVIDIGANIGGYTLFSAALTGPTARLLAIEPQPEIFERLVYNIRQNGFAWVKALNCAIADKDGDITLFVAAKNRGETSMRIVNADAAGEQIRVPAKALSTLMEEEGLTHVDVMKLDVEGAEDLILEPFLKDAPSSVWPKLLLMEYSHSRAESDLGRQLVACGYKEVMRTRTNVAYERSV